jgi:hypothetical protein
VDVKNTSTSFCLHADYIVKRDLRSAFSPSQFFRRGFLVATLLHTCSRDHHNKEST